MSSLLQTDLLSPGLIQTPHQHRILVSTIFDQKIDNTEKNKLLLEKSKSIGGAKSLNEFYSLVKTAIDNFESRANVAGIINKLIFTEEEPDVRSQTETIVFSLQKREPGAFSQGAPLEGKVKNMRPLLREEKDDPDNAGYRLATIGYFHDNIVRFTCWARTNKVANARALWFEGMMEEYSWWFKTQGVDRVLFMGREKDQVLFHDQNKWYGRPLDYFVRTETLRVYSEKTLEEILINVGISVG